MQETSSIDINLYRQRQRQREPNRHNYKLIAAVAGTFQSILYSILLQLQLYYNYNYITVTITITITFIISATKIKSSLQFIFSFTPHSSTTKKKKNTTKKNTTQQHPIFWDRAPKNRNRIRIRNKGTRNREPGTRKKIPQSKIKKKLFTISLIKYHKKNYFYFFFWVHPCHVHSRHKAQQTTIIYQREDLIYLYSL